jgi:hypothetical protein
MIAAFSTTSCDFVRLFRVSLQLRLARGVLDASAPGIFRRGILRAHLVLTVCQKLARGGRKDSAFLQITLFKIDLDAGKLYGTVFYSRIITPLSLFNNIIASLEADAILLFVRG